MMIIVGVLFIFCVMTHNVHVCPCSYTVSIIQAIHVSLSLVFRDRVTDFWSQCWPLFVHLIFHLLIWHFERKTDHRKSVVVPHAEA